MTNLRIETKYAISKTDDLSLLDTITTRTVSQNLLSKHLMNWMLLDSRTELITHSDWIGIYKLAQKTDNSLMAFLAYYFATSKKESRALKMMSPDEYKMAVNYLANLVPPYYFVAHAHLAALISEVEIRGISIKNSDALIDLISEFLREDGALHLGFLIPTISQFEDEKTLLKVSKLIRNKPAPKELVQAINARLAAIHKPGFWESHFTKNKRNSKT